MTPEKDPYSVPSVDVEPIENEEGMNSPAEWWVVEMMRREVAAHFVAIWKRLDKLEGER